MQMTRGKVTTGGCLSLMTAPTDSLLNPSRPATISSCRNSSGWGPIISLVIFTTFNGVLNALLQGRIEEALNNTVRVITNSTIGILGLFDVASQAGVPRYETDFGHTLSVWGVPQGNFVMLPFIGPSTVRAASGSAIDAFISPTGQMFNDEAYWGLRVFNLIDLRAGLLDAEQVISGDRYVFFRDVYLQRRAVLDAGGQVKDDFSEFDNDWDEDAF